jgi:hypothetical protein
MFMYGDPYVVVEPINVALLVDWSGAYRATMMS